ncbi:MAG: hypothetical protein DRP09_10630 [Candidatus Thorarchaeota archaeon]|nr:MAG: hypothetical protein DRP09_10630 [Candidatus Thorarchaeota archaeon]
MAGPYNKNNFSVGIATKQMKVLNPDNLEEVVQIGLTDTGMTTASGEKIFSLMTGGAGGATPALPSSIPTNPPITITATAATLPDKPLVNGAVLRAPSGNVGSIWLGGDNSVGVGNGYELPPGENVPIAATNLNKFWVIGTAGDKLQWLGG